MMGDLVVSLHQSDPLNHSSIRRVDGRFISLSVACMKLFLDFSVSLGLCDHVTNVY